MKVGSRGEVSRQTGAMLLEGADAVDIALARAEGDIDDEDAAEEEAVLAMRHNFVDDQSWRDVKVRRRREKALHAPSGWLFEGAR